MGHTTNTAAAHHNLASMRSHTSRLTHSTAANSHASLSPYSATHSTFHRPSSVSTAPHTVRNPLTPSYTVSAYPICTPPPPAFVHSSLDISDISRSSNRSQRQQSMHTRDHINVYDIEGAQTRQHRQAKRPTSTRQQYEGSEPTGLLRYVRPAAVDTRDVDRPDDTDEPFSTHFTSSSATSPATPASPPTRPRSSPPTTAATHPTYRSPYNRFAHSPHVLTPPSLPFHSLYHVAIPSTDTVPPFRCTLQRSSALPSNCTPMGGVDGSELDESGKGGRKRKCSRRMKGVSARVQCWRASGGEVERSTAHSGGGQWQRIRVQDIELVSSLTL